VRVGAPTIGRALAASSVRVTRPAPDDPDPHPPRPWGPLMEIAGIAVDRLDVLVLAERLSHGGHTETAAYLLIADACYDDFVGLSIEDREAVLAHHGLSLGVLASGEPAPTVVFGRSVVVSEQQPQQAAEKAHRRGPGAAESEETQGLRESSREPVESGALEDQLSPQEANPDAERMAREQSQGETVRQQR
jgi:hypothetical protein